MNRLMTQHLEGGGASRGIVREIGQTSLLRVEIDDFKSL